MHRCTWLFSYVQACFCSDRRPKLERENKEKVYNNTYDKPKETNAKSQRRWCRKLVGKSELEVIYLMKMTIMIRYMQIRELIGLK